MRVHAGTIQRMRRSTRWRGAAAPILTRPLGCLLLAAVLLTPAAAQTLRWSARGDTQSMDPYALQEGVTINLNALVYDTLVERDERQNFVPALATRWSAVDRLTWRFELRRGVTFTDGSPFTADDAVFSIERAQQPTSAVAFYAKPLGSAVRIDDHTIELRLRQPNPILLQHVAAVAMMSRAWATANRVERVPNFKAKEEAFSSYNAMGTGRFILRSREPGVRTVLVRNPKWWGQFKGNVAEVVYTPIENDSTRSAALIAGDIDFVQDAPPQDLERIAATPGLRLVNGVENRVLFFGFDQWRDELVYSNVRGKNPFKDVRVREAFFRAVNAEALRTSIMRGQSVPTACMAIAAVGCMAQELELRPPPDLERARRLMAEAGYPNGFEVTLDCPNDRYVNDRQLCVAMVGMLARINVTLKVDARPKSVYFPKIQSGDTSFYLLGWGGSNTDAQTMMDTLLHSPDPKSNKGGDNNGRIADPELDRLIDAAATESDPDQRNALIASAQRRTFDNFYTLPVHRQMLTWAASRKVTPVVTANNMVRVDWIRID